MLFEELLTQISKAGPCYRWTITILIAFLSSKAALDMFVLNVATSIEPYYCDQALVDNETIPLSIAIANFTILNNFSAFDFTCYKPTFHRAQDGLIHTSSSHNESDSTQDLQKCTSWRFVPSPPDRWSMFIEYEMVCDQKYLMDRMQTVYQFGIFVSAAFGPLGDIIGRKSFMVICCYLDLASNIMLIFVKDLTAQMVLRFFMGFGSQAMYVGVMLITEIVGEDYRSIHANLFWILWVVAYSGSAGIGYFIHNWRMQMVAVVVIIGSVYATYIPVVPESPRWLLTRGNTKRAKRIMKQICKFSGCKELLERFNFERNDIVNESRDVEATERNVIFKIIPRDNLCRLEYFLAVGIITFNFFSVSLVYFALSFQRDFIFKDPYLNVVVSGILELPAYIAAWQMTNRLGRKYTTLLSFSLCGLGLIVLPFIPSNPRAVFQPSSAIAIVVKFCVSIVNSVLNVYGYEVFPTKVRSCSFFFACFVMGAGLVLAPELGGALAAVYEHLAFLLYGTISVLSGVMVLLLPETKEKPMPNTVAEMEPLKNLFCSADSIQETGKQGPDIALSDTGEEVQILNV